MSTDSQQKEKIKTPFAKVIVDGRGANSYFSILYFDPTDKDFHIGYGSYYLDYVFNWLDEEFEIIENGNFSLTALSGPTREMVERVFPGCDGCKPCCGTCEKMYSWDKYGKPQECDGCKESGYKNYQSESRFCEYCGKPLTDEAVDMMVERMREIWPSE